MPVVQLKDGNGVLSYWLVSGSGTPQDPYVPVDSQMNQMFLRKMLSMIQAPNYDRDSSYRQKVVIDSISGSLTLGTITTITNALADMTKFLGFTSAQFTAILALDPARTAYNSGVRQNLVFKKI